MKKVAFVVGAVALIGITSLVSSSDATELLSMAKDGGVAHVIKLNVLK
ncbi:hypothetical protein [Terribacillus saccharophilus]|nr:hypothetical protein [Terribacillus saccharophilus]MCM3227503.1 hypothetical protein [Terribacillus saccharophilus]